MIQYINDLLLRLVIWRSGDNLTDSVWLAGKGTMRGITGGPRLPEEYVGYLNIFLYTDQLGKVGRLNSHTYDGKPAEPLDFVESLRTSNGKHDVGPIVASRLVLLQADKTMPVYLLSLRRTKWE